MTASPPSCPRAGFTLLEVLAALAICVLLAVATASAIAFAARAEQAALRDGDAALLLPALYAAQRLRADDLPVLPPGWRADASSEFVAVDDDLRQEWRFLAVVPPRGDATLFLLRTLDAAP